MKYLNLLMLASTLLLLGACRQTPSPDAVENIEAQFWLSRTYVDKDAVGLNDGTNWQNAFNDLQDALDCVRAGTCPAPIWVAAGVYYPDEGASVTADDPAESFYLIEGVNMYGGFDGVGAGGVGGVKEVFLFQQDITLYKTILSGDIQQDDIDPNGDGIITDASDIVGTNSQHVVYVDAINLGAITDSTVLNGFRITAGSNGAPGGSGLICYGTAANPCSPKLKNLVFKGNKAALGGGMYALHSESSLTHVAFISNEAQSIPGYGGGLYSYASNLSMDDVVFRDNNADYGAGMYLNSSDASISNSVIETNDADWHGGGIFTEDSFPTLTNVTFDTNSAAVWGGGMFNVDSAPIIADSSFYGNSASGGGAIANEITGGLAAGSIINSSFVNTVFSGNAALDDGGALYFYPNSSGGTLAVELTNTTFNRNDAVDEGGSIYTEPLNFGGFFDITLANSIMWNSTDSGGFNEICLGSGQVNISYSDVRAILAGGVVANCDGGISIFNNGGNNRNQAPQFIDFDGPDGVVGTLDDNLDLQSTSPMIDRGSNVLSAQPFDILGRTRIVDGDANGTATVDLGAYEYQ